MHLAAIRDESYLVRNLVEKCGADLEIKNNEGMTPLLKVCAAKGDLFFIFKYLIRKGANVNTMDNQNLTPLFYAYVNNKAETITILEQQNAKFNTFNQSAIEKALIKAIEEENIEATHFLLNRLENSNYIVNDHNDTLLHFIIKSKTLNKHKIQKIYASYDYAEVGAIDYTETSVFEEPLALIIIIINKGAWITIKNKFGQNALDLAKELNRERTLKYLTELENFLNGKTNQSPSEFNNFIKYYNLFKDWPEELKVKAYNYLPGIIKLGFEKAKEFKALVEAIYKTNPNIAFEYSYHYAKGKVSIFRSICKNWREWEIYTSSEARSLVNEDIIRNIISQTDPMSDITITSILDGTFRSEVENCLNSNTNQQTKK
ncbi:MAG: ankyrin repeat domain-containing protein [Sphingobacteriia bacterium]|nr:ankyrin repeat domain-containing protein [Sphingobacteriia bacterium]